METEGNDIHHGLRGDGADLAHLLEEQAMVESKVKKEPRGLQPAGGIVITTVSDAGTLVHAILSASGTATVTNAVLNPSYRECACFFTNGNTVMCPGV
jgi:hypothetical protein